MIKTNAEKLVKTSVVGEISPPSASGYRINVEGKPMVLPGVGGITYNIRVGDIIAGWEAPDHPCFGNGNDPEKMPHPFHGVDPAKTDILVIGSQRLGEYG